MFIFFILRVKIRLILNQIGAVKFYLRSKKFFWADCLLFWRYLFSNPYRMCRKFLEKRGADEIHAYGETPLITLEKIVASFAIHPEDKWLELGSGRGRGCFWISEFWGCRARGIEWIPTFVSRASWIAAKISTCRSEFYNISMQEADFTWPDGGCGCILV